MTKRVTLALSAVILAAVIVAFGPGRTTPAVAEERGLTFEVYKDAKEEFRWRLKAGNGKVIAVSGEGYKAKTDCQKGIELIQTGAAKAKVEDTTAK
jgi:uncharacterized protein YegP (UPF0339 family)